MKLLIDAGNQRLKWATSSQLESHDNERAGVEFTNQVLAYAVENFADQLEKFFSQIAAPERIYVSSVADSRIDKELSRLCLDFWNRTPEFLRSCEYACGLHNGYKRPETLGIDRWAALVGASKLKPDSAGVLVIDAGTAVTVDYLPASGCFKGGIIFPGISTMIGSLDRSTGRIRLSRSESVPGGNADSINLKNPDTSEAVSNGVLHTVVCAINGAIDIYRQTEPEEVKVILTGGDAGLINSRLDSKVQMVPQLVLMGVLALGQARDNASA